MVHIFIKSNFNLFRAKLIVPLVCIAKTFLQFFILWVPRKFFQLRKRSFFASFRAGGVIPVLK